VTEVETPWLCLQEDLRRAGIDPGDLNFAPPRSMSENVEALRHGDVDVVQVFEPFVENLVRENQGHVWYASATRGLNTYTTLFTTTQNFSRHREVLLAMTRAIYTTQRWLHSHSAADVSTQIAPFFPDLSTEVLTGSIDRYKSLDIWASAPLHTPVGFLRLKTAVVAGRWVKTDLPFDACLTTELAECVVAEHRVST
jgi:NitT/TauT family transport system substrate-binding protein